MRVPQVSERIKEAPAQALRGVFAGIGQLLLYTDKLRNKTPASQQVPQARAPEPAEQVTPAAAARVEPPAPSASAATASAASTAAAPSAAPPAADRDFDKTGNVRLLTGTEAAAGDTAPAAAAAAPPAAAAVAPPTAEAVAPPTAEAVAPPAADASAPPAADASAPPAADLPLANYDELSVASLRARLRNLDVTQLGELAGYERAHAGRTDVITMFERRIAKLEAETSSDDGA